eukprot:2087116-Pyramimonas_sp.AAC.1
MIRHGKKISGNVLTSGLGCQLGDVAYDREVVTLASVRAYLQQNCMFVDGGDKALENMFREADFRKRGQLTRVSEQTPTVLHLVGARTPCPRPLCRFEFSDSLQYSMHASPLFSRRKN